MYTDDVEIPTDRNGVQKEAKKKLNYCCRSPKIVKT